MANPRIDELRKRLEREPGSRLFAQLAEELRKEGELAEAIRVARAGLQAHPTYPSARMTLGRALFDTRDLAGARGEFESVLRGAPDNILASRMLGECLEGMGDLGAALLQFRAAMRLAPGDRLIEGQIRLLEQRLGSGAPFPAPRSPDAPPPPRPQAAAPPLPAARATSPVPAPPVARPANPPAIAPSPAMRPAAPMGAPLAPLLPPLPASSGAPVEAAPADTTTDFDDVFEAAPSWQRPTAPASGPIVLLDEDEAPTLPGLPNAAPPTAMAQAPVTIAFDAPPLIAESRPTESPRPEESEAAADTLTGAPAFAAPPAPAPSAQARAMPWETEGDLGTTTAAFASVGVSKAAALDPERPATAPPPPPQSAPEAPPETASPSPEAADLSSTTLAELYFEQGFLEKSVEVYEQLLERDPYNERARARLIDIKALGRRPKEEAAPPPEADVPAAFEAPSALDARAERRLVLERTITRLEGMLAAVKRA